MVMDHLLQSSRKMMVVGLDQRHVFIGVMVEDHMADEVTQNELCRDVTQGAHLIKLRWEGFWLHHHFVALFKTLGQSEQLALADIGESIMQGALRGFIHVDVVEREAPGMETLLFTSE